uniref:Small ribosomal subunit protein uS3c n=1 Tax=Astrosyne radiata TaxID=1158023 RepID=A0A2U9NTJ7_9STRA|nr:ribosomal protein S3 [Astrosyne radiata]AWT40355.1 ribosomal protein S3 [Astrosyne radiata]
MGQKIHPLGFRLNITKPYQSIWYACFINYAVFLREDIKIRKYLETIGKNTKDTEIYKIKIIRSNINQYRNNNKAKKINEKKKIEERKTNNKNSFKKINNKDKIKKTKKIKFGTSKKIKVQIFVAKSKPFEKDNQCLYNKIVHMLKTYLSKHQKLIVEILPYSGSDKYVDISAMGDKIIKDLEKRLPFRRTMYKALNFAPENNGIKIQISGRLNGIDMARHEWKRKGRVPLQTLNAEIDYILKEAHTIYGIFGVKIWIFRGRGKEKKI